mmetsp:Transcript_38679/g.84425  ORF Transcript_38679/g.84425 Transcript_38679/m.84425 type:complete len:211 (-) Transcript_38679:149-781(-)
MVQLGQRLPHPLAGLQPHLCGSNIIQSGQRRQWCLRLPAPLSPRSHEIRVIRVGPQLRFSVQLGLHLCKLLGVDGFPSSQPSGNVRIHLHTLQLLGVKKQPSALAAIHALPPHFHLIRPAGHHAPLHTALLHQHHPPAGLRDQLTRVRADHHGGTSHTDFGPTAVNPQPLQLVHRRPPLVVLVPSRPGLVTRGGGGLGVPLLLLALRCLF